MGCFLTNYLHFRSRFRSIIGCWGLCSSWKAVGTPRLCSTYPPCNCEFLSGTSIKLCMLINNYFHGFGHSYFKVTLIFSSCVQVLNVVSIELWVIGMNCRRMWVIPFFLGKVPLWAINARRLELLPLFAFFGLFGGKETD